MRSKKIILVLVLMVSFVPVFGINFDEYKAIKASENSSDKLALEYYISGLGSGYFAANNVLKYEGNARFYCQPEKLLLKSANYMDILEKKAEKLDTTKSYNTKVPIDMILLEGLRDTFPCK